MICGATASDLSSSELIPTRDDDHRREWALLRRTHGVLDTNMGYSVYSLDRAFTNYSAPKRNLREIVSHAQGGLDERLTKFIKPSEFIHIAAFMDINPIARRSSCAHSQSVPSYKLFGSKREREG